jgi:hypothetical protein
MSALPGQLDTDLSPAMLKLAGAQTTVQRWYLDPLIDNSNVDRTLRTVLPTITLDHPRINRPAFMLACWLNRGISWRNPEDGTTMGGPATPPVRVDGGPTSWKVDILTKDGNNNDVSYREFALEFHDLQLAYAWAPFGGTIRRKRSRARIRNWGG